MLALFKGYKMTKLTYDLAFALTDHKMVTYRTLHYFTVRLGASVDSMLHGYFVAAR